MRETNAELKLEDKMATGKQKATTGAHTQTLHHVTKSYLPIMNIGHHSPNESKFSQ
jgi:hypothetical protein